MSMIRLIVCAAILVLSLLLVGCQTDDGKAENPSPSAPETKFYVVKFYINGDRVPCDYWSRATLPEEVRPGVWVFTNLNTGTLVTIYSPNILTVE